MAARRGLDEIRSVAHSPQVHLATGLIAVVASAADVLDVALVEIVGFHLGSEVAILAIAVLHVLKGLVDVMERSGRIRQERRATLAEG
jgi:hypothetical protein